MVRAEWEKKIIMFLHKERKKKKKLMKALR